MNKKKQDSDTQLVRRSNGQSSHAGYAAVGLLISGCTVGPDYSEPTIILGQTYAEGGPSALGDVAAAPWWHTFRDPLLDQYVQDGLKQNIDILEAFERILQAEADVVSAASDQLPDLALSSEVQRSKDESNGPDPQTSFSSTIQVSWLLDLFGRYRRSKEQAIAELGGAYADADTARLTLLANIASAYIDARYYQARRRITETNLRSRVATLNLTRTNFAAGGASRLDVAQAEGLVASTKADLPGTEISFRSSVNTIATLLAVPNAEVQKQMTGYRAQPVPQTQARPGVPADLIRNRPDIRSAERAYASKVAAIGVAQLQFYPSISLSGSLNPAVSRVAGSSGSLVSWSFGPSLDLPIFDGGQLKRPQQC